MPNTVVLTMFREDFKHLIALAHKFKSEKVLASLPDVRVFSLLDGVDITPLLANAVVLGVIIGFMIEEARR